MSRTLELRARVTALSSIHHGGGQSIGINQKLRREKFMQPDGAVERSEEHTSELQSQR